jgi:hypothetical protein
LNNSVFDINEFKSVLNGGAKTCLFKVDVGYTDMSFLIYKAKRISSTEVLLGVYETADLLVINGFIPTARDNQFTIKMTIYDPEGKNEATVYQGDRYRVVDIQSFSELSWEAFDIMKYEILIRQDPLPPEEPELEEPFADPFEVHRTPGEISAKNGYKTDG